MARKSKIPENLIPAMMEHFAKGESADQIQSWLLSTYDISISVSSINKKLKSIKIERKEIAQTVLTDKISKDIVSDLDLIQETIELLHSEAVKSMTEQEKLESRALLETMGRFIDRKSNLLGLTNNKSAQLDEDSLFESLLQKLEEPKIKIDE
jgi:hypothetical protein